MNGSDGVTGSDLPGSDAAQRATFAAAYQKLLANRTAAVESIELSSDFGVTRVHASGPTDAPAVVLVHAYQATSGEWNELADLLSTDHRVYAVDMMGDAGFSTPGGRAIATPEDLVAYLDTVLDGLAVDRVELCGHSFGAWIALTYALARPSRVNRLVLLDPTMCFGPLLKGYVLRAIPAMMQPSSDRRLSLIRWESRRAPLDQAWLDATGPAADAFSGMPTVPTRIPAKDVVAKLEPELLVVLAERSRVIQARAIAKRTGMRLPDARVEIVAGASHYGLPITHATEIAALLRRPTGT